MDFTPIARQLFARAGRRTARWSLDTEQIQRRELARIVHAMAATRYGEAYGLQRGDGYTGFRRKLPMVGYEDIRPYVMRMVAGESDVLWPGRCLNFAQSSGTSGGKSKFIPVTRDSLRLNHFRGAADAVAHYLRCNPRSRMFSGKGLILGGSFSNELEASALARGVRVGDLSATLIDRVPFGASLFRIPRKEIALMVDWQQKLPAIADASIGADVTNLSGVPSWFLTLLREILARRGADSLADVWPNLEVFFHGGISFAPYRKEYERITRGLDMHFVENYNASEGFFACQDTFDSPGMLLLIDSGIFYEFLPLGAAEPVPVWEVQPGAIYEPVITSVNGLCRYRLGDTVRIETVAPVRVTVAGRTKSFINAFGEEVMEYNAEAAISHACHKFNCSIRNYTVAPLFAKEGRKGRHQWFIEWLEAPADIEAFADELDKALQQENSDYQAKRSHDLFLDRAEVLTVAPGTFDRWLSTSGNGKLGGQRKIPRLSNDRTIAQSILSLMK